MAGLTLVLGLGASPGRAQVTERVSVAADGTEANAYAADGTLSADGRVVAFASDASNLVAGDTNGYPDVFVHDRLTGVTERVNVASDDAEANSYTYQPTLSADGRSVAYVSDADNLVVGDTNGALDVFVHDRQTAVTERVSVASDGSEGNGHSSIFVVSPGLSADGRFVAFASDASNLVAGDTNGRTDVFVHDRQTGVTERVSVASDGTEGDGASSLNGLALSADGRFVAFDSEATNLVPGDTNVCFGSSVPGSCQDVFVHDRQTAVTERVSVASDGAEANDMSIRPALSADGRFVAWESGATNLVAGDTNGASDVFVHDRQLAVTERMSVASDGTEANGQSSRPALSGDGRFVAWESGATNLVAGDTNVCPGSPVPGSCRDVFVHDRQTGETHRVSLAADGTEANRASSLGGFSADGLFVVLSSVASNLVADDTNGIEDVFVRYRAFVPPTTTSTTTTSTTSTTSTSTTTLPTTTTTSTPPTTSTSPTTTTTSRPPTPSTTLPCTSARCIVGDALSSSACADQAIPAHVTQKLDQAIGFIEQAATSPARKAGKLVRKAKQALREAKVRAARATRGKHPKLTPDCAPAIRDAADRVRASL